MSPWAQSLVFVSNMPIANVGQKSSDILSGSMYYTPSKIHHQILAFLWYSKLKVPYVLSIWQSIALPNQFRVSQRCSQYWTIPVSQRLLSIFCPVMIIFCLSSLTKLTFDVTSLLNNEYLTHMYPTLHVYCIYLMFRWIENCVLQSFLRSMKVFINIAAKFLDESSELKIVMGGVKYKEMVEQQHWVNPENIHTSPTEEIGR